MKYEAGMQIIWDVVSRDAVVIFRELVISLDGPFENRAAAIMEGEACCRRLGWGSAESEQSKYQQFDD